MHHRLIDNYCIINIFEVQSQIPSFQFKIIKIQKYTLING